MIRNANEDIINAVFKRACGNEAKETVEEYAAVDGSFELVKRKVTVKDVPPDMTAAKMLFDSVGVSELTDEQLEKEKIRLLRELNTIQGEV